MDRTEPSFAPLELEPRGPLAMAARLWRSGQNRNATIVVKATLTLVAKGVAALTEPEPVLADDVWSAGGVLLALNELAPYLPGADILLTADAHAPTPTPIRRARARLLVKRGQERLVDKTLFVLGDLAATGEIVPFVRIGLAYDRAVGGRDNPLGRAQPGVIDPSRPEAPAGFGPIPGSWPVRARLRGKADTRALEASIAELPTDLDAAYFHAAPPDQRVERLVGDETIELTGMHPRHEKFETRLPALRASLLVGGESVPLRLDTLRIDLSNERCYLLWRAIVPLEDEALKAIGTIERRDPVARAAAVRAVMATGPLDSERAPPRCRSRPPTPRFACGCGHRRPRRAGDLENPANHRRLS